MNAQAIVATIGQLQGFNEFVQAGKALEAANAPGVFFDALINEAYDRWGQRTAEHLTNELF